MATFGVRVAAPADEVFDYLADPRNRPAWQSSLRSVRMLDDGPPRLGTRWVDHTAAGVRPVMEIVDFAPPQPGPDPVAGRWTETGRWRGIEATLALTFEAAPDDPGSTDLWVVVDVLTGPLLLLPLRGVLRRLAPPAVRSDLRRAARILESR